MRKALLPALLCLVSHGAVAQNNPPLQEMQNPPVQPDQDSLLPPALRRLWQPPATPAPAAPANNQADTSQGQAPAAPAPPPLDMTPQVPWPNKWQPASAAKVQALDKVNAQAVNLTVKVGQAITFESLTIDVKACLVRPPDQPADAAAYLQVTDGHPDAPGFTGWMLANEPAVSMMQSPIYDIRVVGCT